MFKLESNQNIVSDTIDAALSHDHRDHLLSDGLTESHIYLLVKDYGVRSIGEIEARELGFVVADEKRKNTKGTVSSSGIYFPFRGEFGQLRCDNPPIIKGKRRKYLSPIGQQSQAWLPDSANVVTEGFKDAAAGTFHGRIATGAIAGVSHYRKALPQKGGHTLLFDSDGWTNPSVFAALVSAAAWTGGKIQLIPEIEGQPKAGLCEYFKAGHTAEDYQTLIAGAMSIGEFLLELPNRWGNMPTKYLARALRTIVVLGVKHLSQTEFAILTTRLKRFGKAHEIPASEVTRSVKAAQADQPSEKRSTADQLIDIGRDDGISYFKTPDGVVYADLSLEGKRQTVGLRSKGFRQHLRATMFDKAGKSPGSDAVQQAIDTLEALASRDALERKLSNRIARDGDDIYIDLANDSWNAIRVTPNGWEVVTDYPIRFRRGGCAAMPEPTQGGSLEDFRSLCQFDDANWVKILCWIVQAMIPSHEYPILVIGGAHGAGKTTITKAIKQLIDPTTPLTRSNVGDVRGFAIHASKRHTIAIDNLSGLTPEQSDILCRAATGGGHSERTLQTDDDETIFEFINPMILNGIGSIATRDDLLDRALVVGLQALTGSLQQGDFNRRLEAMRPGVFGALLDLISKVCAILPAIQGTYHGTERFTGFMEVSLAVERASGWAPGTVLGVFGESRAEAHQTAVESSPVGLAILDFMANRECWTGPANELWEQLSLTVSDKTKRHPSWPANGRWLSDRLCNRLAPDLKALGIEVTRDKSNGARGITIERIVPAATVEPQAEPARTVAASFTPIETEEIENYRSIAETAATASPEAVSIAWQTLRQLTDDRLKKAVWRGLSATARSALEKANETDRLVTWEAV
jgi:energy-coupling factor transporter ATP-binding protein EcfA2